MADKSAKKKMVYRRRGRERYTDIGLGTTILSPLASGLLTGKYKDGIPAGSRGALAGYEWLESQLSDEAALAKVERLRPIAEALGCTLAQMCLAWCAANPNVSSVITAPADPARSPRTLLPSMCFRY